jgi:hypothetical protein
LAIKTCNSSVKTGRLGDFGLIPSSLKIRDLQVFDPLFTKKSIDFKKYIRILWDTFTIFAIPKINWGIIINQSDFV